ncbi:MAG: N-acetyltransferase [Oscillospiraceae bacterium]|nr:N-acetyltransferase [Oscillospiraceae bacterium]
MEFTVAANEIYYEKDGVKLAWVIFPSAGGGIVDITTTVVDGSLQGHGVAGRLMEAAAGELRKTNRRAKLTCAYAVKWFEKHAEYADVLT